MAEKTLDLKELLKSIKKPKDGDSSKSHVIMNPELKDDKDKNNTNPTLAASTLKPNRIKTEAINIPPKLKDTMTDKKTAIRHVNRRYVPAHSVQRATQGRSLPTAGIQASSTRNEAKEEFYYGDKVHLGFGKKGGAGMRGSVHAFHGDDKVTVKSLDKHYNGITKKHEHKFWKGPRSFLTKESEEYDFHDPVRKRMKTGWTKKDVDDYHNEKISKLKGSRKYVAFLNDRYAKEEHKRRLLDRKKNENKEMEESESRLSSRLAGTQNLAKRVTGVNRGKLDYPKTPKSTFGLPDDEKKKVIAARDAKWLKKEDINEMKVADSKHFPQGPVDDEPEDPNKFGRSLASKSMKTLKQDLSYALQKPDPDGTIHPDSPVKDSLLGAPHNKAKDLSVDDLDVINRENGINHFDG